MREIIMDERDKELLKQIKKSLIRVDTVFQEEIKKIQELESKLNKNPGD